MSRQKRKDMARLTVLKPYTTKRRNIRGEGYFPGIDTPTFFHYTPQLEIELISVFNQ
jgi:hypothetical protein